MITFLNFSCGTVHQINRNEIHSLEGKKIIGVVKSSGEEIRFTEGSLAQIEYNHITGWAWRDTTVVINYEDIDQIIKGGIITKDGKSYLWRDYRVRDDEEAGAYLLKGPIDIISIPLSDVKEVIVFSRGKGAIRGAGTGFLAGVGAGLTHGIIFANTSDQEYAGAAIILFPPLYAVLGSFIGLLIGASKGTTLTYKINGSNDTKTENNGE